MTTLGKMLQIHAFALRGEGDNLDALKRVVARVGMVEAFPGDEKVWDYGKIGTVSVVPIIESFMAMDAWPEHGGKYLVVASCRPYEVDDVRAMCVELGYTVTGEVGGTIAL